MGSPGTDGRQNPQARAPSQEAADRAAARPQPALGHVAGAWRDARRGVRLAVSQHGSQLRIRSWNARGTSVIGHDNVLIYPRRPSCVLALPTDDRESALTAFTPERHALRSHERHLLPF
jgi:hypothetical protein